MKKILSPTYSLKLKNIILFLDRGLILFQMVIFATLFRRCPTLWKSILKMTTTLSNVQFNIEINNVVSTFLNVVNFNVDVHNVVSTLILRCVTSRRHINLQTTLSRPWNVWWKCSKIVWFIKIHFVICYIWLIIYDWSCNVFCPLVLLEKKYQ